MDTLCMQARSMTDHMGTMVGVPGIVVVTLEFPCVDVSLEIFAEIEEFYSLIIR